MLNLHENLNKETDLFSDRIGNISETEIIEKIKQLKIELKDKITILGHHYQQDEIIQFADMRGDSLKLAQEASKIDSEYIIFCGVHFMAETCDILTRKNQHVILPDMEAGCSMADMASRKEIDKCWEIVSKNSPQKKIIPITYVNCTADLKAFVGENNGSICTSSNAEKIIKWGLDNGDKLLFFPDQHLGRNTCYKLGIPLEDMVIYDPNLENGGLTPEEINNAKIILWYGYCSVHQGFTKEHIDLVREKSPQTKIIVHPECNFEVVMNSDQYGSTAYIINEISKAKEGTSWAVGTEINLVNRLATEFPQKEIFSLSPYQCLCSTMYRVRPKCLLSSLMSIKEGNPINIITVNDNMAQNAIKSLNTMLQIS